MKSTDVAALEGAVYLSPDGLNPEQTISMVQNASRQVALYRKVVGTPAVKSLLKLLALHAGSTDDIAQARYRFLGQLAEAMTTPGNGSPTSADPSLSAWQRFLLDSILFDDNPFTLQAERTPDRLPQGLLALAAHDLRALQQLYAAPTLLAPFVDPNAHLASLAPEAVGMQSMHGPLAALQKKLAAAQDWGDHAIDVAQCMHQVGAGDFGRYIAFRWDDAATVSTISGDPTRSVAGLVPINEPDLVDMHHLIDYDDERNTVFRNTEKFVQGLPAHNVLLYGDRGTGKSATVKAMLHHFAPAGLRMVEIPRSALADLPRVLRVVRARPQPIILFIDDLSFEEGDSAYKELKAVLEGTLDKRPKNVLVYATSNRRHLIQEHFSDRKRTVSADGEVNPQDTVQEKLSLADRFGLTVIFPSPDQTRYITIVAGIAKSRGLVVADEDLRQRALQWATWHNGRSARTAQQFVDHLEGELALQTTPAIE